MCRDREANRCMPCHEVALRGAHSAPGGQSPASLPELSWLHLLSPDRSLLLSSEDCCQTLEGRNLLWNHWVQRYVILTLGLATTEEILDTIVNSGMPTPQRRSAQPMRYAQRLLRDESEP
jgi:hypothetical protein